MGKSRSATPLFLSPFAVFTLTGALLGCGGGHSKAGETSADDAGEQTPGDDAGTVTAFDGGAPGAPDAGHPTPDASPGSGADAGIPSDPTDGNPTRQACTNNFGTALTAVHGRLDGTLVSIVQPGAHGCNADSSHLHLQILMNGSVYDVATNLDTYVYEQDMAIPDGAYSEGWHTASDGLDYPSLGVHSSQFTHPASQQALAQTLTTALENANHLSVFAMGYGPAGIHDVHRKGSHQDGAIVVDPLSATPHIFFFCFNTDSF